MFYLSTFCPFGEIEKKMESHIRRLHAVSLQWLNAQFLKVGQPHQVWKSIPHDVRIVKRAYRKLCLLTGTFILQENRARFKLYSVRDCCLLCTRTHFIAGCSRLEPIRVIFKEQFTTILSRKKVLLDKEKLDDLIWTVHLLF